ncbi:SNAP receptor [Tulasnella sp. 332]|nr:SNAP receptor [Tulasnella sp. 332]
MVRSTILARASDALPLAASVDDEQTETALQEHKQQAKLIFRRITPNSEPRCSIESGTYTLHYLITNNVVYLTIAEKSYPRKLAFSYLDELSKEFEITYGPKVETARKPYAFVGFDNFMSKTARLYQDTRTASAAEDSMGRLNGELQDVTRIMTKNMEELLWRGDSLDSMLSRPLSCESLFLTSWMVDLAEMSHLSTSLRSESEKYRKAARQINVNAMLRQWAPVGGLGLLFIIIIWWKFF